MSDGRLVVWGDGVPVVLVHGSIATGAECWEGQRALADLGFELLVPNRQGYRGESEAIGEDFLQDAEDVAELMGDGAHLVGHSYGGLAVLLTAAARPGAVLSVTVAEPAAFSLGRDDPAVDALVRTLDELWRRRDLDDREFLVAYLAAVDSPANDVPAELLAAWAEDVPGARNGRQASEAEIPLDRLRALLVPKLVVSGGQHPAFETVCDRLADGLDADRLVIRGAGHEVQTRTEPFNEALLELWRRA